MCGGKKKLLAAILAAAMVIGSYPGGSILADEIPMEMGVVEEEAPVEFQSEEIPSAEIVPEEAADNEEGEVIFEDSDSSDASLFSDGLLVDPETEMENEEEELEIAETEGMVLAASSGTCGASLTYKLTGTEEDGYTLEIIGSGDMTSYSNLASRYYPPWYSHRSNIINIILPEGLTSIGDLAFSGCSKLTTINLPDSLTHIGIQAFTSITFII